MNYFTALLVAAGLPVAFVYTPVSTPPVSVSTPTTASTAAPASESQPVSSVPSSATPSFPVQSSSYCNSVNTPAAMIALINQARAQDGLAPYSVNSTLMQLAQERAVALANGPFTSDLPGYGWPSQMEQAAGIQAQGLGAENIAEAGSVAQAFSLLMASAPHRSNILNPDETQVGVGVTPWGSGYAISELFIGPNT